MITLHISSIKNEKINELITYRFKHTYLDKYIQEPVIDQTKLTALSTIVNNTSLSEETKQRYIISTMLVQAALDTHELVPVSNSDMNGEVDITSKQLTVLAGDYYSGLYYLLLSEIEDIPLISKLASAIKEITEFKMKLHYQEFDSFTEYLEITEKVESLLITRIAEFVNNSFITDTVSKLIITSKLIEERKNFPSQEQAPLLDNWITFAGADSYASTFLSVEKAIQANINQIESLLTQPTLGLSMFESQIQSILDEFIYNNISVAEEG